MPGSRVCLHSASRGSHLACDGEGAGLDYRFVSFFFKVRKIIVSQGHTCPRKLSLLPNGEIIIDHLDTWVLLFLNLIIKPAACLWNK